MYKNKTITEILTINRIKTVKNNLNNNNNNNNICKNKFVNIIIMN